MHSHVTRLLVSWTGAWDFFFWKILFLPASELNFSRPRFPGCDLMVIASYPTVDNRESGGMQSLVVNQH